MLQSVREDGDGGIEDDSESALGEVMFSAQGLPREIWACAGRARGFSLVCMI